MGVSKKGRRRITVGGRSFIWYVCEDHDSPDSVLHVISEDKHFLVEYHLDQLSDPFLNVIGLEFTGIPDAGRTLRRFRCPRWESNATVTPADVRSLIEWCFSADKSLHEVNWRGEETIR